jgi:hypothetical protein
MYSTNDNPAQGCIIGGGAKRAILLPESIFNESIIYEILNSIFF